MVSRDNPPVAPVNRDDAVKPSDWSSVPLPFDLNDIGSEAFPEPAVFELAKAFKVGISPEKSQTEVSQPLKLDASANCEVVRPEIVCCKFALFIPTPSTGPLV